MKTYNVLSDLFPYKSKPIKRQKNTKFNKLYKKAEGVGLSLHKNNGYYDLIKYSDIGSSTAVYKTLKEVESHINRIELFNKFTGGK